MIGVLVVEDEEITAEAHRIYVGRVPGFTVAGVVRSGGEALRFLGHTRADLLLLDLYLPDMHGLEVCRAVRAGGLPCDVIAVTSARDLEMVRSAVSLGVAQYLLKPFTFATLQEKLLRYARFREEAGRSSARATSTACWARCAAPPRCRRAWPRTPSTRSPPGCAGAQTGCPPRPSAWPPGCRG